MALAETTRGGPRRAQAGGGCTRYIRTLYNCARWRYWGASRMEGETVLEKLANKAVDNVSLVCERRGGCLSPILADPSSGVHRSRSRSPKCPHGSGRFGT